jgi:hypothetical protein
LQSGIARTGGDPLMIDPLAISGHASGAGVQPGEVSLQAAGGVMALLAETTAAAQQIEDVSPGGAHDAAGKVPICDNQGIGLQIERVVSHAPTGRIARFFPRRRPGLGDHHRISRAPGAAASHDRMHSPTAAKPAITSAIGAVRLKSLPLWAGQ